MKHKVNSLLLLLLSRVTNVESLSIPPPRRLLSSFRVSKTVSSSCSSYSYSPPNVYTVGHLKCNHDWNTTPTATGTGTDNTALMTARRHHGIIESSSLLRSHSPASPISISSNNSPQDPPSSSSTALYGSIDKDIESNSLKEDEDDPIKLLNKETNIVQAILSLALPALAGLIIDPLMTLADTVFVGREATNADSLAGNLLIFIYMFVHVYSIYSPSCNLLT